MKRTLGMTAVMTGVLVALSGCWGGNNNTQPTPTPTIPATTNAPVEQPAVTVPSPTNDGGLIDNGPAITPADDSEVPDEEPPLNGGTDTEGGLSETLLKNNIENAAEKQSGVDDAEVIVTDDNRVIVSLQMRDGQTLSDTSKKSISEVAGKDYEVIITTDSKHHAKAKALVDANKGETIAKEKVDELWNLITGKDKNNSSNS